MNIIYIVLQEYNGKTSVDSCYTSNKDAVDKIELLRSKYPSYKFYYVLSCLHNTFSS